MASPDDALPSLRASLAPSGHWLFGHGPRLQADPLGSLAEMAASGPIVRGRMFHLPFYLVSHPEAIQRVLADVRAFDKRTLSYRILGLLVGEGLVTSEGDRWKRQRRTAQPAFHRKRIAGFAACMVRAAEAAAARWEDAAARGEPADASAEMTRLTLGVTCETLLGGDDPEATEAVAGAFAALNELTMARMTAPLSPPLWAPTPANRRYNAALATLDACVYRIIARRRADPGIEERPDLLSMLLLARDEETGAGMDDAQLRDEVATILFAGYETTATALAWAFHLLSTHPEAAERLRAELAAALGGRAPGLDDLERLPWTRQVIEEAMRLYPPVWMISRNVAANTDLLGCPLERGAMVFVSPWVVHRHPGLWDAPESFRPERFDAEKRSSVHKYAYFPFLGGPRQCIGNHLAMMEMQLVLATLAQRLRFAPADGSAVVPDPLLTLRPRDGVWLRLQRI